MKSVISFCESVYNWFWPGVWPSRHRLLLILGCCAASFRWHAASLMVLIHLGWNHIRVQMVGYGSMNWVRGFQSAHLLQVSEFFSAINPSFQLNLALYTYLFVIALEEAWEITHIHVEHVGRVVFLPNELTWSTSFKGAQISGLLVRGWCLVDLSPYRRMHSTNSKLLDLVLWLRRRYLRLNIVTFIGF